MNNAVAGWAFGLAAVVLASGASPEIHQRYAIDTERIYAAGFSGTVYLAFQMGKETGGLAGIVAVGGRDFPNAYEHTDYAVWERRGTRISTTGRCGRSATA